MLLSHKIYLTTVHTHFLINLAKVIMLMFGPDKHSRTERKGEPRGRLIFQARLYLGEGQSKNVSVLLKMC